VKSYYRVMLGRKSVYASEAFVGGFIGADFSIQEDLSKKLPEQWRDFNKAFIPVFLEIHPDRTRIGAGLAMGALWTVAKGIHIGDIVLSPDGGGGYRVGDVTGDYHYVPGEVLPHRRPVRWSDVTISRADMSEGLRHSCGSIGTSSQVSKHAEEIERFLKHVAVESGFEDPAAFALEKHLEDFLVQNWNSTELSRDFDIYQEVGELIGQQFPTDTGPIDILAISKDRRELLVVELKKGRASDVVVGQILRYMGYVKDELAEPEQVVRGVVIALEDDQRLRRALAMVPTIRFYRYEVTFKLVRA
jgi:restriction system protein